MKILVLGSSGQLGTSLQKISSKYPKWNFSFLKRKDLDLSEISQISKKLDSLDFDVLINGAAYNFVDLAEEESEKAFLINTKVPKEIAKVCSFKKARLIHVSTDYVFSGEKTSPYLEEDSKKPLSIYAQSKSDGEDEIVNLNSDYLIFRTASVYGLSEIQGKKNFVDVMLSLASAKKEISVIDDRIMSPTSSDDLASMILKSIELKIPKGIYHAVNSDSASWYEFAKEIFRLADFHPDLKAVSHTEYPSPAKRPLYSVLENTKLIQLGISCRPWKEALKDYLNQIN